MTAEQIEGRKFISIDGFKVAYREFGEPGNKPILLLHGIPMNSSLWSRVGPLLAERGYHVVAPGQLGLSYTTGPIESDHSLRGQAELFTAFADEIFDQPFILFGHDLGGGVAQIMVTDNDLSQRNNVSKIVIGNAAVLDMWPVQEANVIISEAKSDNAENFFTKQKVSETVVNFASAGLMQPEKTLTEELKADLLGNYAENPATRAHFIEYLKAMDNKWTMIASPKMVMWNKPALLLWAVHDKFQPPHVSGIALARIMPHADWQTLDASHFYPLEKPLEVVEKLVRWDRD